MKKNFDLQPAVFTAFFMKKIRKTIRQEMFKKKNKKKRK